MANMGIFQLDKIIYLRSTLKSKGSKSSKQIGVTILIGMQKLSKASRFQNNFIAVFFAKANERLKTQKIPKTICRPPPYTLLGVQHQNTGPDISISFVSKWAITKNFVLKGSD